MSPPIVHSFYSLFGLFVFLSYQHACLLHEYPLFLYTVTPKEQVFYVFYILQHIMS